MPLLVICGPPGSGKTTRAKQIEEFALSKNIKTILLNEEILNLEKENAYKDSNAEKISRGFLRSNTEKNLNNDNLVIVDSLNYIKGFRYEIYCLARAAETSNALVFLYEKALLQ